MNELAWAAGLFEGEGCITTDGTSYPVLAMQLTDEDTVRRFHAAVGGKLNGPYNRVPGRRPVWDWKMYGFEKVQATLAMLWGGLGERRKARAREVLRGCV